MTVLDFVSVTKLSPTRHPMAPPDAAAVAALAMAAPSLNATSIHQLLHDPTKTEQTKNQQ